MTAFRRLLHRGWNESIVSLLHGDVEGRCVLLLHAALAGATIGVAVGFIVGAAWLASTL